MNFWEWWDQEFLQAEALPVAQPIASKHCRIAYISFVSAFQFGYFVVTIVM